MNYAVNTKSEGYISISFKDRIKFKDDKLLFKNINEAYKYLYYSNENTFEIQVDKYTLKDKKLLRILARHNANIKFINKSISLADFVKVNLDYQKMKLTLSKVEFKPTLMEISNGDTIVYVLDGYVVNLDEWDYYGSTVNGILDYSRLPFEVNIKKIPDKYRSVNQEYKWGARKETYTYSIFDKHIKKNRFLPKVYIYNIKKVGNKTELSIFFQGYEHYEHTFKTDTTSKYLFKENDDWKYYSKVSSYFKSNFKTMILDSQEFELRFSYEEKPVRFFFSRHLQSSTIINDLYVENYRNYIKVSSDIEPYKSDEYIKFEQGIKANNEEFYLFSDRQNSADDNAEALYRYYQQHSEKKIYFAVEKDSNSWTRLEAENFNLVDFGSQEHKMKYLQASKIISSHAARRIYDPFFPSKEFINLEKWKFVFLQHGIVMGKHHGFLDCVNNKLDLIITSTNDEKKIIEEFSGLKNIVTTGLARYDNYKQNVTSSEGYIVYAPSWNVLYKDNLQDSLYAKEIKKVINSETITKILKLNDLKLYIVMHPEFINLDIGIANTENIEILGHDEFQYSKILNNAIGLITDYSSLLFDILYQRKFVIEHQPYELHHENRELTGYQSALYKSYNIKQLEKILTTLNENSFKLDNTKLKVLNSFFEYDDELNCQRNYEAIENIKDGVEL